MDTKETHIVSGSESTLLSDAHYYKYIFKKTEKIVCAVFYIFSNRDKDHEDRHIVELETSARELLNEALGSLSYRAADAGRKLHTLVHTTIVFQSHVRLAHVSGVVEKDIADLLLFESESVLRTVRQYLIKDRERLSELMVTDADERAPLPLRPAQTDKRKVRSEKNGTPRDDMSLQGQLPDRQKLIKDILLTQGQSTIKDISAQITECSEKTIQRELIDMINKGQIVKEGERRWSKYALPNTAVVL